MKTTVNERLETLIKSLGLTRNSFAKVLGIATTQVYNICNGRNAPSYDFLTRLAASFPTANLEWFITGRGTPLKQYKDGTPAPAAEPQAGPDLVSRVKYLEEKLIEITKEKAASKKKASKKA